MFRSLGSIALIGVLSGCSVTVAARGPAPTPEHAVVADQEEYHIPPGHMPPPGGCRAWYPGQPPGHQPPADDCGRLLNSPHAGAVVLYRPNEERRVVRIG